MTNLSHRKLIHELSQHHIQLAASSIGKHLERVNAGVVTQIMFDSLLMALMDKNELVSELYAEIDRLKAVANEAT